MRVPEPDVDELEDSELIDLVIQPTLYALKPGGAREDLDEVLDLATPGQRALLVIQTFTSSVKNGGLYGFFLNSTGVLTEDVVRGLYLVGANNAADTLREAIELFPGAEVPLDRRERETVLDSEDPDFDELDKHFYRIFPSLRDLCARYIRANRSQFFKTLY